MSSGYINATVNTEYSDEIDHPLYIEISTNGISTVKTYETDEQLLKLKQSYLIESNLKSGDRIIVNGSDVAVESVSGRKKISLGIPIGINSAMHEDLTAIAGIGDELARRIIN